MPFTDPPVPSTFDVGNINAGHAHFDTTGVTFYGTDGVTALFHFDFATGILTFTSQSAANAASVELLANALEFLSNVAQETAPARIIASTGGGGASLIDTLAIQSGALSGQEVATISLSSASPDGATRTSDVSITARTIELFNPGFGTEFQMLAGAFQTNLGNKAIFNTGGITQRGISAATRTGTTDPATGQVTFAHGLANIDGTAATPTSLVAVGQDAVYMLRVFNITNTNFTLVVRNSAGALVLNTSVTIMFIAYG